VSFRFGGGPLPYARWFDASLLLRIGRRKMMDRNEGSSGLRFDAAE